MRVLGILLLLIGFSNLAYGQMSATSSITQGKKVKIDTNATKWSASSQFSASRNQDYYSDAFTSLSLGVGYQLSENLNTYVETGYARPVSDNHEKVKRYGISDLDFGLNIGRIYKNRYNFTVGATTALSLPTSEVSKKASLIAGWSGGLTTSTPLQYGFNVSSSHIALANWYTYETANKAGTVYNYPWGFSNSLALRWSKRSFYTSVSYAFTHLKNFAGTSINIQSTRAGIGYSFNRNISAELYGQWKDRVLTNNSMFDDDNTYTGFLLTATL